MLIRRRNNRARGFNERDSLLGLGKLVVPNYASRLHWYHSVIAEALEGLIRFVRFKGKRGGYARVLISMPARHGKSLHGVELLPALILGRYPDEKLMIGTASAKLAKKSVRNTRNYMQHSAYQERYATRVGKTYRGVLDSSGAEVFRPDDGGKLEVENTALMFRTIKRDSSGRRHVEGDGYYMAQGIGGSFIGEGYTIGIIDDPIKNAEQALNPDYLKKLWDFYLSTFDTRADHPWAGQLFIGHRWTSPDFVDELKEHWQSESTEGHPLPIKEIKLAALATEDKPEYDPREVGEGLDKEETRPRAWYEGKRNALLSRRPWVWFGMWQQAPTMDGSKFFQRKEWRWYGPSFLLAERLLLVDFSIDAALSTTGSSFYVINVWGYLDAGARAGENAGEHFFWLGERRGHWTIEQLYSEFEYLWRKWSRALPKQFDELTIRERAPELYEMTRDKSDNPDPTKHHARPRVWCENKASGHSFNARFKLGAVIPNVTTTLTTDELYAVGHALYPVPKATAKVYCYRTAGQVTASGRVWLPREGFGEDPLDPSQPLVDATPLAVTWGKNSAGEDVLVEVLEGGWVHEMESYPREPDDRRDTTAQEIMCRTPWIGPGALGQR